MLTILALLSLLAPLDDRGVASAAAQTDAPATPAEDARLGTWVPVPLADGLRAAVPVADGTVRIFRLETGATDVVLEGHVGTVFGVEPSPAGETLASCGKDGTVRVWDLTERTCRAVHATPRPLRPWWGDTLAFSPAGDRLVAVGGAGWGRVWDVESGEAVLTLPEAALTLGAAWTPDGRLVSVGGDKKLRVWDVDAGREVRAPLEHEQRLGQVACHPDGVRVATAGFGTPAWIWNLETGERLAELRTGPDLEGLTRIRELRFTPGGEDLLISSDIWSAYAFDADTAELRWSVENNSGTAAPLRIVFDHAGERVGLTILHRIVRREDGVDVAGSPLPAGSFKFSPGDRYLVAAARDETFVLDGASLAVLYTRSELPAGRSAVRRAE